MGLAIHIVYYARNEVEDIAIVACDRVRNVNDVYARKLLLRRSLGRIDVGLRFHHIHDLANFTLMRELYLHAGSLPYLNGILKRRVEALFLNVELVARGREI